MPRTPPVIDNGDYYTFNGFNIPKDQLTDEELKRYDAAVKNVPFSETAQKKAAGEIQNEKMRSNIPENQKALYDKVYGKLNYNIGEEQNPTPINVLPDLVYEPLSNKPIVLDNIGGKAPLLGDSTVQSQQPSQVSASNGDRVGGAVRMSHSGVNWPAVREDVKQRFFAPPPTTTGVEEAAKKEMEANAHLADTQALTAQHVSDRMALANQEQENMLRQQEEQRKLVDAEVQKRRDTIDKESDRLATEKIDSKKFWNDRGNATKFLAGVSFFLGEVGKAMTGSNENAGWKIINDAITRDVEDQKINLEKAYKDLQGKKENLAEYKQNAQLLENRAAIDRETKYKIAIAQVEQLKQSTESQQIKDRLDILNSQLNKELEKTKYNADLTNRNIAGQQLSSFMQMDQIALAAQANALKKREIDQTAYFETKRLAGGEKERIEQFFQQVPLLQKDYEVLNKMGILDEKLPDWIPGHKSAEAARADLVAKIANMAGMNTDQGRATIDHMMPRGTNTPEVKKQKAEAFSRFINSFRPATPILQWHGELPMPKNVRMGYTKENLGAEEHVED